ncbi:hypothetical protein WICANDRAFT_60600 [Wickerhamomyces anomalus NRRL Y-366-8]|uniref:Uncharacterized protein n=1 Tax=Wickerhamomyces anomalus (strain ATCC 58044 / CBS 1984 / NCYC 433 / NRRL Y-366-8) TaxID=683960 RepID=A0A1E3PAV0_WICAA|nr:uncharacterized protein WICANDRAFT_60600 [Wickerhamomyces anomalus NRRL Y-366-8]ODQ62546.1 hypothetical protein WICANDRAFT_60600 [Wickerhamomyces anomalus NRRL Y-366-8]
MSGPEEAPYPKRQKRNSDGDHSVEQDVDQEPVVAQSKPSATTIKKANEIFDIMRTKRLSMADFVASLPYVSGNKRRQEVIVQSLFQNEEVLMELLFRNNFDVDFNPLCKVIGVKILKELGNIQQSNKLFGKFQVGDVENKDQLKSKILQSLEIDNNSVETLYKQAPILTNLFKELLPSRPEGETNSTTSVSNIDNRLILILSVICYSRNKKRCTNLPVLFGLYLNSLGLTTKRGLQVFNKFGISVNQKSIIDILDELSRLETARKDQGSKDQTVNSQVPNPENNSNTTRPPLNGPLVLPFTQNIISSTTDAYKPTSSEVLKISDAKFDQLFDQYTNNTTTDNIDHIDPKISNEMQQSKSP